MVRVGWVRPKDRLPWEGGRPGAGIEWGLWPLLTAPILAENRHGSAWEAGMALPAAKPWHPPRAVIRCQLSLHHHLHPPQPRHLQPQPLCTLRSLVWNRSRMFPAVHPIQKSLHPFPLGRPPSSAGLPSTPPGTWRQLQLLP